MKNKTLKRWLRKSMALVTTMGMSLAVLTGCGSEKHGQPGGGHGYYDDYDDYDDWDDDDWGDWDDWDDEDGYYDDWSDDGYDDDDYGYDDDDYGYDDDDYGYDDDDYGYDDDDYDGGSGNGGSSGSGSTGSGAVSQNFDLFSSLGSAGEMNGKTVILSIYATDKKTSWSSSDSTLMQHTIDYLGIATSWLKKQASAYGKNADFVYDWSKDENLYYTYTTKLDLTKDEDSMDFDVWDYIEKNIDSKSILNSYNADNIIYMVFINTPGSNSLTSCTRNYYENIEYPYEVCFMYMHCDNEEEAPAAFAHEILHTFGAPDLYMADTQGDNYGITKKFVQEMERTQSNDIMYTTYDAKTNMPYYDHISNEMTELDAYYVGLTDYSAVAEKWGFDASQH